jgi:uncharacterized protein (TIGR00369 family)
VLNPDRPLPAPFSVSGLEFLRRILRGELPGAAIGDALGFRITEVDEGRVVFEGEASASLLNPMGVLHGGFAATLLDSAMACAVQSTLPAGVGCTSLELKVNFVRALLADSGRLRAEGRIVHRGSRTATAEGRMTDAAGRLCAHGTTTLLLLDSLERSPQ